MPSPDQEQNRLIWSCGASSEKKYSKCGSRMTYWHSERRKWSRMIAAARRARGVMEVRDKTWTLQNTFSKYVTKELLACNYIPCCRNCFLLISFDLRITKLLSWQFYVQWPCWWGKTYPNQPEIFFFNASTHCFSLLCPCVPAAVYLHPGYQALYQVIMEPLLL